MALYFDRRFRLTLSDAIPGSFKGSSTVNAIVIDNLSGQPAMRMIATVKKSLKRDPNAATFKVYGLSEQTRKRIAKGSKVRLEAGYVGRLENLFEGDVRKAWTTMEGPDRILNIEAGDGERAFRYATVSESFANTVSLASVVEKCAVSLGVERGNLDAKLPELRKIRSEEGYVLHGSAADALTEALTPAGYTWSIQDGALQILSVDESTADVVFLSPATGLIGSPELGTGDKKRPIVKLRSLLRRYRVGGRVALEAIGLSGVFKPIKLEYALDTRGTDWYANIEAVATEDRIAA